MNMKRLTQKQEKFIEYYCEGLNKTEAARRAGYKNPSRRGSENVKKRDILEIINKRKARLAKRSEIKKDELVDNTRKIQEKATSRYLELGKATDGRLVLESLRLLAEILGYYAPSKHEVRGAFLGAKIPDAPELYAKVIEEQKRRNRARKDDFNKT